MNSLCAREKNEKVTKLASFFSEEKGEGRAVLNFRAVNCRNTGVSNNVKNRNHLRWKNIQSEKFDRESLLDFHFSAGHGHLLVFCVVDVECQHALEPVQFFPEKKMFQFEFENGLLTAAHSDIIFTYSLLRL